MDPDDPQKLMGDLGWQVTRTDKKKTTKKMTATGDGEPVSNKAKHEGPTHEIVF